MSILGYIAIALAIFVGGAAGGIKWHAGQDAIKAEAARDAADEKRRMDAKQIDTAAAGHEADKRGLRTEFVTITQTVEKLIETPVYRDGMCLDADGLRVLRAATGAADAASQPTRTVPGPGPTR